MSEAALVSTVVIAQFGVLAGLVLYLAQRIERRIDRLEARTDARFDKVDARFEKMEARFDKIEARFEKMEARFEKIQAQLRLLEIGQAKLVGRLFGDDRNEFELSAGEADVPLSGATAPAG